MTPPGIEPETVRLVAQCLNHYATPGPGGILVLFIYITRLASNEIFSPSNKIYWGVGRAKDVSATPVINTCNGLQIYLNAVLVLAFD